MSKEPTLKKKIWSNPTTNNKGVTMDELEVEILSFTKVIKPLRVSLRRAVRVAGMPNVAYTAEQLEHSLMQMLGAVPYRDTYIVKVNPDE